MSLGRGRFVQLAVVAFGVLGIVLGTVADMSAVVDAVKSSGFRKWIEEHPFQVFWIGSATSLCSLIVATHFYRQARAFEAQVTHTENSSGALVAVKPDADSPTSRDRNYYDAIVDALPPRGEIIEWLKDGFSPLIIPIRGYRYLDEHIRLWARDPCGFDDATLQRSFEAFLTAGQQFIESILTLTIPESVPHGGVVENLILRAPPESDTEPKAELTRAHRTFIDAYDEFLRAGRKLNF